MALSAPREFAGVATLPPLPLVGRASEFAMLSALLDQTEAGQGSARILVGEGGLGKTRLALAVAERASKRGFTVGIGRAYPLEAGIPYALFADALLPLLRALDAATLATLTRGGTAELAALFPALGAPGTQVRPMSGDHPAEFKTRLLWNFAQFLGRFGARNPLLLVLDNLQWADASSLELLHFVARQLGDMRVALVCAYNDAERERDSTLRALEQSLSALGAASVLRLQPLARSAIDELVRSSFGVNDAVAREFSAMLYGWTRGNPFFVEETLKSLIESGKLYQREGAWKGWDVERLDVPRTIRDALLQRLDRLQPDARRVAELTAVMGTRVSYNELRAVTELPDAALVEALDELRLRHVLEEHVEGKTAVYDFSHPMLRDTLYGQLGHARARLLHASIAEALERLRGPRAAAHANELAFHFSHATAEHLAPKAAEYMAVAGRQALAAHADREAADYLSAAVAHARAAGEEHAAIGDRLMEDLARARQRLGQYDAAIAAWEEVRSAAVRAGDDRRLATIEQRMGLAYYWSGHLVEAIAHYDAGLAAAGRSGDEAQTATIRLARGICLQEQGRSADAGSEIEGALRIAEQRGDDALLARAHRSLLLLSLWTAQSERAREHGKQAISLARRSGEKAVECSAHWALAMLGGLTGNAAEVTEHLAQSERLAEELNSPVLRVWNAEIAIEYASATGDWDEAIAVAERMIALARRIGLKPLLPRLLVWSGLIYLGRNDLTRAKMHFDEAWALSGAADARPGAPIDVHSVVPAHTGMAAYHLARSEFAEALAVGKAGLRFVDETGYIVWAVHRLLPIIGEAALEARDLELAEYIADRLRHDSDRLNQRAGRAWGDACSALVAMLRGESDRAIVMLRAAAEALEAVPVVWDAARVRRQLARILALEGRREEAMRELRLVHDLFARLGAARELDLTRSQMRQLGSRPPSRVSGSTGAAGLTGRELEIARLVAARKSNKEIGRTLDISTRTVSTHLTNIFTKLGIASRAELADYLRDMGRGSGLAG